MKFPLQELPGARYVSVSPENILQVWMPVVSGRRIGLDNTCKAVYALQEFFGKGSNSNKKATIKDELLAYQEALKNDIILLGEASALAHQKQERLMQIEAYLAVVIHLEEHAELDCLNSGFPSYPRPLESMMASRATSNLYSMILRPTQEDGYIRTEGASPVFSVGHRSVARNIRDVDSPLQQALIEAYTPLRYESKDLRSQVIQQTVAQLTTPHIPVQFVHLRQVLQSTVQALLNETVDFTITQQGTPLQQQGIDAGIGLNPQTATPEDYIEALLGYSAPNLFEDVPESPFHYLTNAERWSVATQFLLGITNIYGVSQGKISRETNFGRILDSNPDLSKSLATLLAQAQKANADIEEAAIGWINAHVNELELKSPFTLDDLNAIKKEFASDYSEVKASLEFDEFFILDTEKKGDFVIHQGSICTNLAKFASDALLELPEKLNQVLEKARQNASSLDTEIPHQNPLVQETVEITTDAMDKSALQNLYERIDTYKDPKVKKDLISQLKQERPDFKPKIDAKQFLQCVAYGQRKGAEDLLKQNEDMAQELLTARKTSFTDYSGRTFKCTAYEYAYWAKDTRMCRMLEKYMDAHTKQELLKRCQKMEEMIGDPLKQPRGIAYTQHGKDYRSAHVDLERLKDALKAYRDAYKQSPKKTDADWDALDKIWIKVGLPQRDVPAHIVHEYCHPRRSFERVSKNHALLDVSNDENFEGTLEFFNSVTRSNDEWFTPDSALSDSGLGSSFAIVRSWGAWGVGCGSRELGAASFSEIDLSAIEAIDEARTEDLKQSLVNLTTPPSLAYQQSHG